MSLEFQMCGFILILFASIHAGNSLTCFQCTSPVGGSCDDPLNVTLVKTQKCTGSHNACLLLNVTSGGHSEIRRECSELDYCSRNDTETRRKRQIVTTSFSRSCNACSWSYCNSAQNISPSFALGLTGLIMKYVL